MAGYRLANYQTANGVCAGIIIGRFHIPMRRALTDRPLLRHHARHLGGLAARGRIDPNSNRDQSCNGSPLADTRLRAPLLLPGAIYCAGAN